MLATGAVQTFCLVLAVSLLGIATRQAGIMATFWPANALLLGFLVRNPRYNHPLIWSTAYIAYLTADLVTRGDPTISAWLAFGNLAGVIGGYALFSRVPPDDITMARPRAVLNLVLFAATAALCSAFGASPVLTEILDGGFQHAFAFWATSEFANYIMLLPVAFTAPRIGSGLESIVRQSRQWLHRVPIAPLIAVAVSVAISIWIGGPGAIAFVIPALVWCGLTYSFFVVSIVTAICANLTMVVVIAEILDLDLDFTTNNPVLSIRLGISLMALGPLTVASLAAQHARLVGELAFTADHDFLTGAATRGAFSRQLARFTHELEATSAPSTLMLIDLDHFKETNDRFGHLVGDQALIKTVETIRGLLPEGAIVGRLGGEEFVVFVPHLALDEISSLADDMRHAINTMTVTARDGALVTISASIGLKHVENTHQKPLEELLGDADEALYQAKSLGRNQMVVHS